jgi:ubiquinone/menaquinone biosynthesis C-methylase UbiE
MQLKEHWEHVYSAKSADGVSWFQRIAARSLRLIRETDVPLSASIIDVGGGASTLVDDLLYSGYSALTVLDISASALAVAKKRMGQRSDTVQWVEANVTNAPLPTHTYDIWHDRAVFHFLTSPADRRMYVEAVIRAVKPGGYVIVATFAEDGPTQCSGLPIVRYSPDALQAEFGTTFTLLCHEREEHRTPTGAIQAFIYCCWRKSVS